MLNVFGQEFGLPITINQGLCMLATERQGGGAKPNLWTPLTILEVPSAITEVPAITFATDSVNKINLHQT